MNNNTNTKTRNAIVSAINNLIEANSKDNPYDKTFIGRITDDTNSSKNLYNVSINGKIYENIKGLPLFNFKNNSIVYCIAPQGNMNLLRIVVSLDKNIDIILKNIYANNINANTIDSNEISSDIISVGSSQLTDSTGLLNLTNANGMKINSNDVDPIVSKSLTTDGYIKYSSGLTIQWGRGNIATGKSFPITFSNNVWIVSATPLPETSIGTYANLNIYDLSNSGFTARMGGSSSTDTSGARYSFIAIGN